MRHRRLFWLLPLLAIALAGAVGVAAFIRWYTREPRTFSAIDTDLYMGGYVLTPPPGTRAVLSLSPIPDLYSAQHYQWSPINDGAPAPTLDWLRQQVDFVAAQRRAGLRVYVHCNAGISRSGMVVTAYLMEQHRWRRDEALAYIRARRAAVGPNPAFMALLQQWEDSLGLDPSGPATRP